MESEKIMRYPDDKEFIKSIGKQIRKFRLGQKMTQLDLAVKSGMEENALQRIERGRINPTIRTLLKIVNALDVDYRELFNFSEE